MRQIPAFPSRVVMGQVIGPWVSACGPIVASPDVASLARAEHEACRDALIDIREPGERATGLAPGAAGGQT